MWPEFRIKWYDSGTGHLLPFLIYCTILICSVPRLQVDKQ